jgi:Ankyrin repeats (3 copies)
MSKQDIFEAARSGDVAQVQTFLSSGVDVSLVNDHGFTALQCAAMGTNSAGEADILAILRLLIAAGSPLEFESKDGRTALYLAAEFSRYMAPVQMLIDAGAKTDIYSGHGPHVVVNAMMPAVQALLSQLIGYPIPAPRLELKSVKLNAAEWREVKARLDPVFDGLAKAGLVVQQNVGTTQSDGFDDCAQEFHERGEGAGLHGFCFYTGQDLSRAKRTSSLSLAFWGAPAGEPKDMERVGKLITEAFKQTGFVVDWNGSASMRPTIYLQANCE